MMVTVVDIAALRQALADPELQVYTVVVMACQDLDTGNVEGALARLRTDADKLRTIDKDLYRTIMESAR
jgi:hypothetical protein